MHLRGFYKCGRKYSLKIMRIKWYEITFIDNVKKWGIFHRHKKKTDFFIDEWHEFDY